MVISFLPPYFFSLPLTLVELLPYSSKFQPWSFQNSFPHLDDTFRRTPLGLPIIGISVWSTQALKCHRFSTAGVDYPVIDLKARSYSLWRILALFVSDGSVVSIGVWAILVSEGLLFIVILAILHLWVIFAVLWWVPGHLYQLHPESYPRYWPNSQCIVRKPSSRRHTRWLHYRLTS